ncbi:MAG TPA: CehA/McbA family metallohydrolase [Chitinophagaceae bacterium]
MYIKIYSRPGDYISFRKKRNIYAVLFFVFFSAQSYAQKLIVDTQMHHLRKGDRQEWLEFDEHSEGSRLVIHFTASSNNKEQTLSLNQYDVSQPWNVLLNDQKIGELTQDEKYLKAYFIVPPQKILQGYNTLIVEPADTIRDPVDDISVGNIILENILVNELLSQATVDAEVTDANSGQLLPSRVTIIDNDGALQPVGAASHEHAAVRTGCVYTGDGKASFGLPAGVYTLYATRGFEYGVDSMRITLGTGDHFSKRFIIKREVPTSGWVSSDTHIHTLTYSGHGDATIKERAFTIAGEGIELPIITEHNLNVDISPVAETIGVRKYFTPVTGDEVTTSVGHFNVFPLSVKDSIIDYKVNDWNQILQNVKKPGTVKAVILNHARDIHNNFRPFDDAHHISVAGINLTGWAFPANAMEVMNSSAQQQDIMRLYNDWFGMLNRGYHLTPVGSSDSHDVNRYLLGQGRTYIRAIDTNVAKINTGDAINNFIRGKVMVSFGLLAEIKVGSSYEPGDLVPASGPLTVSVRVLGPAWIKATHIMLYANGKKIKEATIANGNAPGIKYEADWVLPKPKHDVFLVAIAEGPGVDLPFWPIAKPFQHNTPDWTSHVIGSSGALWIDADNDKHFSSALEYAKILVEDSKSNLNKLIKKLETYDEAVAVQAAALLYEKGVNITGDAVTSSLAHANTSTKNGFESFIKALKDVNR